ncbi:MAG: 2-polyprenyl-3-methyl-6-methoxy-1,4-benzoquinone monooxygenase [Gammaproteobacteria bacterium]|nr:2-polyprenyl-3-methyl-6-methoxy-1,4-benzoquinone monooxygenase [Gammaproteobacteria bacterium]
MDTRNPSPLDQLICRFDQALRTVCAPARAGRASPAQGVSDTGLDTRQKSVAARLMRVNHAGEVAAQALYRGHAFSAATPAVRAQMERAAREESDHLAWCEQRVRALGSHTSFLNPLWYTGSFALGVVTGLAGDTWSLGFVAETERQVVRHLDGHLARLPEADAPSRAILAQMRADEAAHAAQAIEAGAGELPPPVKTLMQLTAQVMTRTAYWL